MTSVYDSANFKGRVNLAASYIAAGRQSTRTFDTCFEMHDGDVVAAALVRRAAANPAGKLASNLFKYIGEEGAKAAAATLSSVATGDLPAAAANVRREAEKQFKAWMESRKPQPIPDP